MFLLKRFNGIYYLVYKDENNRRRWLSTKARKKSDALKFLLTFKIESEKRKAPILFSKFMDQFLEHSKSNLRQGTIDIYERTRDLFLEVIGDILLEKLTPYHWDKYQSNRLQKVSPVSVNIELRALRSILNKAFRWKIIKYHPFALLPLCRVPEQYPEYFSKDEFAIFYNAIKDDWFKDVILFAVLTGMRRSEITNLRFKNIDLDKNTIQVVSGPSFQTKSGRKRIVPIHETLMSMLNSRHNIDPDQYVFTFSDRKIAESFISHKFKYILKSSSIKKKGLHFHSLRHTFASWLVQDGVPLYEVQRLLGHSTITTTEIYSHLQPCQLHNAVNKLKILEIGSQPETPKATLGVASTSG
jgi:integrase